MKFGIAGAGSIVPTFLEAQSMVPLIEPYAICASTRSKEKMENFSREYGIKNIYFSYDDMLEDADLEAIYVAVPNHLHYEFTKKALKKGLHVICEKPFCVNLEELEELVQIAEEKDLILYEAICNLYFPNYTKVRELLPELGRIRIAELNYSQYSSRYDRFLAGDIAPVFDPDQHGGALMDLNVYNIHFIVGLFGRPQDVHYYPNLTYLPGKENPIDTSGILILNYDGFNCSLIAAKDCKAPCCINIQGEKGCIHSDSAANSILDFEYLPNKGDAEHYALNKVAARLYYEFAAFEEMARKVLAKEEDGCKAYKKQLEQSLIVQEIIEKATKGVLK